MKKLGNWYISKEFKENLESYDENQIEDRFIRLEKKIEEIVEWINEQGESKKERE